MSLSLSSLGRLPGAHQAYRCERRPVRLPKQNKSSVLGRRRTPGIVRVSRALCAHNCSTGPFGRYGMATALVPIPDRDFDPTETGVPWCTLRKRGHQVVFATPSGNVARADPRMVTGEGLGVWAPLMRADKNGQSAYQDMSECEEFRHPIPYGDIRPESLDGIILPGGHARGMRQYLESKRLQLIVSQFFARNQPVGAICHGVLLAARSRGSDNRSVLYGKRTTALTKFMELSAWTLTRLYLGDYYRTYSMAVEDEVRTALALPEHFIQGPISIIRDSPSNLAAGFTVRDGNYLSARWPGDAHRFSSEFAMMLDSGTMEQE
jgi:putative intracellular protease/amidase